MKFSNIMVYTEWTLREHNQSEHVLWLNMCSVYLWSFNRGLMVTRIRACFKLGTRALVLNVRFIIIPLRSSLLIAICLIYFMGDILNMKLSNNLTNIPFCMQDITMPLFETSVSSVAYFSTLLRVHRKLPFKKLVFHDREILVSLPQHKTSIA